jgi:gas vesicle protein GvpN
LRRSGEGYLEVHPNFCAIFTSNPEEYAGVHKTQDALLDRLITINVGHFDRETEVRVTMSRSGIGRPDAEVIVDIVRELRGGGNSHRPTIRACIAIAKILAYRGAHARSNDPVFNWVCRDVLSANMAKITHDGLPVMQEQVAESIAKVCGAGNVPPSLTTGSRRR